MPRRKFLTLAGAILFHVAITGCSSAPHKPRAVKVEIKDMKFVPDTVTVSKGDTVIWVNDDIVIHDVTEEDSKAWSSGPMASGSTWKMVVAGDADYYCSIHAVMKGRIELE
jgi:plastocyanin